MSTPKPRARPEVLFVQCAPSQLDAGFYSALHHKIGDAMQVVILNDGGGVRTTADPELGRIPEFPELEDGYPVQHLPSEARGGAHELRRLIGQLRPRRLVLQDQRWKTKLTALLSARLRGCQVLMRSDKNRLSAGARSGLPRLAEALLIGGLFQGLAPTSELTRAYYRWHRTDRLWPLPYPTSARKFAPGDQASQARQRIRRQHGIADDAPVLLAVVKFVERENPVGVLRAFARVVAHHPQAALLLVGAGPQEQELRKQVTSEHIPHVHFTGYVPFVHLQDWFHAADVFVHLARAEPWGVSVQDALVARLKVVTSDRVGAGVAHLTGRLSGFANIPPEDTDAATAALLQAIDTPTDAFQPAWQNATDHTTAEALAQAWSKRMQQA